MFRFFEKLVDPYVHYEEEDRPSSRLWDVFKGYSRPFYALFAITSVVSVVVAAIEIWLIAYMGRIVDLLDDSPEGVWQEHGVELILVAAFILLIRPAIQMVDVLLLNNAMMVNFETLVRWRAHRHVLRQSVGWFESDFAGRIANRVVQTPPAAGEVVYEVFDTIAFTLAYLVGAGLLLFAVDPLLLAPLAVWFALYLALTHWTVRRVSPASEEASDARSEVTGRVVDSYSNIHSVKMFAHHDRELDYAREAIERSRLSFAREMRVYTKTDAGLIVLDSALIVSVVGWALFLWSGGLASIGAVAAATALTLRLNAMTDYIMGALTTIFRQLGVVAEGMETIAQPVTLVDTPGARPLEFRGGRIVFDGVEHHYGREVGGIDRVDLVIEPGERIGLVGRSGSGKSTLVKLLLRFYDPEIGRILIDDQDIARVTQDSLRSQVGMVQQDSALLHRSVRDNILYGRPDASEAEMIAAAREAQAHEFIVDLEDSEGRKGYDAQVGERGVKLSGGQRQRVALARVILKDAPILLLDEATSALDSEVEAAIQDTLYGMMRGKTVIAIAHRLSTIARMDRILIMDEGRVVEEGGHQELLARGGLYSRFWARQSGGFLDTQAAE